ncbi:MAG: hypothetical protein ACLP4W_03515 [Mycobacterium sp.]|uniref:hypothetical protein n=1 Tax=Mycobacterium sp. TaxID=1785 RepID=UPI003F9B3854
MTHWSQSGIAFTEGHDGTEILWGYPPADKIDEGIQRLIARLYAELRRYPTVAEIDEQTYGPNAAPEVVEGIAKAARVFREDVGRDPTPAEVQAGLLMADTDAALFTYLELDIQVGDRVTWAERDDNGEFLHQTLDGRDDMIVPAYGTVTAQPEGWHGDNTITRDDGRTIGLGRKWLIKVPG